MSVNNPFNQLQYCFNGSLRRFHAATIVTVDGEVLALRYQTLSDIGTLPVAALTCNQFFQPKVGDVIVMNDPYSGGSLLSSVNLVTAINFSQNSVGAAPDALLCIRVPFKPRVTLAESVEKEGVRIPPTPLVSQGEVNTELMNSICSHPLAPHAFAAGLTQGMEMLNEGVQELARLKNLMGGPITKKLLKDFLAAAQKQFQKILGEMAVGDAKGEIYLSENSRLNLVVSVHKQRVAFNFTGSGAPDRFALSDSATLGACLGALIAALSDSYPINAGLFRCIDVIAPLGSVVHCRYPAPVGLGMTDGTQWVANLVVRLLGQIDRKFQVPQSGVSLCAFELDFGNGLYFYDDLEPGTAAASDRPGYAGLDLWRRSHLMRSVELIEKMYPLRVKSCAVRSQSGGSGQLPGGDGVTKVIELIAPATLRWCLSRGILKPEGLAGGKAAVGPELYLQRKGSTKEELGDQGQLTLQAGDQFIVHSSGGGGFGPE